MNLIIIKNLLKVVFIVFVVQTGFVHCDKSVCQGNHEVNKQWVYTI